MIAATHTIAQRVIHCLAEQTVDNPGNISPADELVFDLGADSLDLLEWCMAIEAEFGIRIDDAHFVQLKTVQHVIDYVRELTGAPA